jgi:energy-coupling factor transporter transmembrane protein EcfT
MPVAAPTAFYPWQQWLAVFLRVLLKGMSGMLISMATVASLSQSDLHEGIVRLPIPGIVSAILLQIIHQATNLFYETKAIATAMAVRGAASSRVTTYRLLESFPKVFLPRVIAHADNVAMAMELRGYCQGGVRSFRQVKPTMADGAALTLASAILWLSLTARIWGCP